MSACHAVLHAVCLQDLAGVERDLELLDKMWGLVREWQGYYASWKDGSFEEIKVEEIEEVAVRVGKSVMKLGRDLKGWPVWAWLKDTIDAFKRTMPLITDLRNPAMRDRHWDQLMVRSQDAHAVTQPGALSLTWQQLLSSMLLYVCIHHPLN